MAKQNTFQRSGVYKDFDFDFFKHPLTNDLSVKKDISSVNQSIKNLLQTNFSERPFQPNIGCNINALLFELVDPIVKADLKSAIIQTITNFEPRVKLQNVVVTDLSDQNAYGIKIVYSFNSQNEPYSLDVVLERLR